MSGIIPDSLSHPGTQPHCIWNPEFASEDTYRQLVEKHPVMKYQAGRACAAAGYADLYSELDILPDVSTAEEARESKNYGSRRIYEAIMSAPRKYKVMDDVNRTINVENPPNPAYLDARTQIWSDLQERYPPKLDYSGSAVYDIKNVKNMPDIEENWYFHFETKQSHDPLRNDLADVEVSRWLYEPLPMDLPIMNVILLRLMAAHDGNIDRYSRLEDRAELDEDELVCMLRGVYHHTMFARWWHQRLKSPNFNISVQYRKDEEVLSWLRKAINARRIMITDVDGFDENSTDLPFVIWWPKRPNENALFRLLENCPQMKHQITVTAIICDYKQLYLNINPTPTYELKLAAENGCNLFYHEDIMQRKTSDEDFE